MRIRNGLRRFTNYLLVIVLACSLSFLPACVTQPPNSPDNESELPSGGGTEDRIFTDAAGRILAVPGIAALNKIYFGGGPAELICLSLAPELAGGTTYEFLSEADLALLPAQLKSLPYLGTQSSGGQINVESLLAEGIQLMITMPFGTPTAKDVEDADDIQLKTGIPVVIIDGTFEKIPDTYRLLGELLGKQAEAAKLIDYFNKITDDVAGALANVPESERVSVYYAEGSDGLQTEPSTSPHAFILTLAGARNVAIVDTTEQVGMSNVSMEQVLAWDPEVIIAWSSSYRGGAADLIRSDSLWQPVQAVQDGRVYDMPSSPFPWIDRPPSINRLLGLQWVANLLYHDSYDVDMVKEVKEFYSLFYHADISDSQAQQLLGSSYPAYRP